MNPLPSMKNPNFSNSLKSRFKIRFLRSLINIKRRQRAALQLRNSSSTSPPPQPPSPPSPACRSEILKRCRAVKIAADKSMAHAVGSKRAWSRALMRRIGSQRRCRLTRRTREMISRRINRSGEDDHDEEDDDVEDVGIDRRQEKELKKLVPGGEAMDVCSLLGETAHYIKCLNTQIQVMNNIVHHLYSI